MAGSKEIERVQAREEKVELFKARMLSKLRGHSSIGSIGSSPRTSCLLLDRSGSMCCPIGDRSYRSTRIEELRKLVREFPGVRMFQYNGFISELRPNETVGDAEGDNDEVKAFEAVKAAGITHVVLLSDGGADEPKKALEAAKGLKIDVCYIGPEPMPEFLKRLAAQTGGTWKQGNLAMLKELVATVKEKLLIEQPRGPIAL